MTTPETTAAIEQRLDAVTNDIAGASKFIHGNGIDGISYGYVLGLCRKSEYLRDALAFAVIHLDEKHLPGVLERLTP